MLRSAENDLPSDADWLEATQFVSPKIEALDLLVVAPDWLDPVFRLHLGDYIPVSMAARIDASSYARIWEFSVLSKDSGEVEGLEPVLEKRFGELRLRLYIQEPSVIVTDFSEVFPRAKKEGQGSTRRKGVHEIGFKARNCMLVTPKADQRVTLEFNEALGQRLVGYVGLADVFTRRDVRVPGQFTLSIDGQNQVELEVGIDDGWIKFDVPTEASASSKVVLGFGARGVAAKKRQLCFAMEARN